MSSSSTAWTRRSDFLDNSGTPSENGKSPAPATQSRLPCPGLLPASHHPPLDYLILIWI